jgi:hypothetical protein
MNVDRLGNFFQRRWPTFILLPLALFTVVACMPRQDEPTMKLGSETTLKGAASLICTEECLQRSQCGEHESDWVVLLSTSGPATENHDLFLPVEAEVVINQQQTVLVKDIMSVNRAWREPFYEVSVPQHGAGWVAGWCIGQVIVP